jgi:ribosome-associated protein
VKGGVRVNRSVVIPGDELQITFSTSGGPGGQHANKTSTRVDLAWNVESSRALGPRQRARVLQKLGGRIDSSGNLRLSSDRYRSQTRNRQDVAERLARTVAGALKEAKTRVGTEPSRAAKERRIQEKKRRAETKRRRTLRDEDF